MSDLTGEDGAQEGIILHRDGIIIDMDEQTAAMFGYQRSEVIGRVLRELIPDYEAYVAPHPSSNPPPQKPIRVPAPVHAPGKNPVAKKTVALTKVGGKFGVMIRPPRPR